MSATTDETISLREQLTQGYPPAQRRDGRELDNEMYVAVATRKRSRQHGSRAMLAMTEDTSSTAPELTAHCRRGVREDFRHAQRRKDAFWFHLKGEES